MMSARTASLALAAVLLATPLPAQMHKVAAPDQVTRAVAVYEYVGDPQHPKAARLIPVSLFIGGHFEDADVYLARPVPFALDSGLRYELQRAGVRQDYLDVVASRHFTSSSAATASPFDNSWFGYGRVVPPPAPKVAKLRPNCGNGHVVQEADTSKKDDGKPHFGSKPADDDSQSKNTRSRHSAAPDPCRDEPEYATNDDRPEKVTLADDTRDKNAPDPERPTLHRSPETTANNTGSNGKPDKKAPKPPPATITANGSPADDPDRPVIRHRTTDENDPNALPPDPIDLASRASSPATAKGAVEREATATVPPTANDTVAEGGTITAGNTSTGAPVLRRGRVSTSAAPAITAIAAKPSSIAAAPAARLSAPAVPPPLDALVAVSDAKERAPHDFRYQFPSAAGRASALESLQAMAKAVLANPGLATDAPEGTQSAAQSVPAAVDAAKASPVRRPGAAVQGGTRTGAKVRASTAGTRASIARPKPKATVSLAPPGFADEKMQAFQLYYGAPVTYTYTACVPATATQPERFVAVVAQTDADGKLQPALRSVSDSLHLDRVPRYRLIDAVDADGSNRASLLMELRAQHSRQFALYRLLGNKPDQIFLSGTTLL